MKFGYNLRVLHVKRNPVEFHCETFLIMNNKIGKLQSRDFPSFETLEQNLIKHIMQKLFHSPFNPTKFHYICLKLILSRAGLKFQLLHEKESFFLATIYMCRKCLSSTFLIPFIKPLCEKRARQQLVAFNWKKYCQKQCLWTSLRGSLLAIFLPPSSALFRVSLSFFHYSSGKSLKYAVGVRAAKKLAARSNKFLFSGWLLLPSASVTDTC